MITAGNRVSLFEELFAYKLFDCPFVLGSSPYARFVTAKPQLVIRRGGKYFPSLRVTDKDQNLRRLHCQILQESSCRWIIALNVCAHEIPNF